MKRLAIIAALAVSATVSATAQAWTLPAFSVTQPTDAKRFRAPAPGDAALIYLEWTPSAVPSNPSKPRLIFNHLARTEFNGDVMLRTYYNGDYYGPTWIQLTHGSRVVVFAPFAFVRGRKYHIAAWWRPVPGGIEAGVGIDGRFVGVEVVPRVPRPNRVDGWLVGARNDDPVSDPMFPGVQHADGVIENFALVTLAPQSTSLGLSSANRFTIYLNGQSAGHYIDARWPWLEYTDHYRNTTDGRWRIIAPGVLEVEIGGAWQWFYPSPTTNRWVEFHQFGALPWERRPSDVVEIG